MSKKKSTKGPTIKKLVGIGASAGGLDAIQELFDNIPEDTGMAFVIIQHLSPDFTSLMPDLLSRHTKMPIFTTEDKMVLQPNCIYLNRPKKNLLIKGSVLYLLDQGPRHNINLPIDIFFSTLGEEYRSDAIGIILSGTGSDGSRGIKTIKELGGSILAQDPHTAQFDGMPNAAIQTGLVDHILSPTKIGQALGQYPDYKLELTNEQFEEGKEEDIFREILELLYTNSGVNFKDYKKGTLLRRIEKRMNFSNVENLYDYLVLLKGDDKERQSLLLDFLIGVTDFFRDGPAWEEINNQVIPELFSRQKTSEPIRIWVPGCSTGEEAYSHAILMEEYARINNLKSCNYKIFATDLDERSLTVASRGQFNKDSLGATLKMEYIANYFVMKDDYFEISSQIRNKIVFSQHNLLSDPPFIRVNPISCRNLMIYLENRVQKKIISKFEFSLNRFGYLFMGASESTGDKNTNFRTMDSKWKIFQYTGDRKPQMEWRPSSISIPSTVTNIASPNKAVVKKEALETKLMRFFSRKFGPETIFITREYQVIYVQGEAVNKLTLAQGIFDNNLLKMVDSNTASVFKKGITQLRKSNKDVYIKDVSLKLKEEFVTVTIGFHLIDNIEDLSELYMITFHNERKLEKDAVVLKNVDLGDAARQRIQDLEQELNLANVELQSTVEQLEMTNEELMASNEELMASNEELQSTNEELESVNEELYMVNSELQEKNSLLKALNEDVNNLLDSTDIGTLFLDSELNIRRFTPALKNNFQLVTSDVGRPIENFASTFNEETRQFIIDSSRDALLQVKGTEREIVDIRGNFFLLKIKPFLTADRKIDGVTISFIDIGELKRAEKNLVETESRYKLFFKNLNEGFAHCKIIYNAKGVAVDWQYLDVNKAFEMQTGGLKARDVIGKRISEIVPELLTDPANWLDRYAHTAETGEEQYIYEYSSPMKRYYVVHVFSPRKGEFAATFSDVTPLKEAEMKLQDINKKLELATRAGKIAISEWDIDHDQIVLSNDFWEELFGIEKEKYSKQFNQYISERDRAMIDKMTKEALENEPESVFNYEFKFHNPNQKKDIWIKNASTLIKGTGSDDFTRIVSVSMDVTEEKLALERIEQEKRFSESITNSSTSGIYIYNIKEGKNEYINNRYTELLGYTLDEMNAFSPEEFMKLFHPEDVSAVQQHMGRIMSGEVGISLEYRFRKKNGGYANCYSVDSPFETDKYGNLVSFIGSFVDVTALKEAERKAIQANMQKDLFLSNMSHEIRTPLNAVIGFSGLLRKSHFDDTMRQRFLEQIEENSRHLIGLIDDVLNVAKIESGNLSITYLDFDLISGLQSLITTHNEILIHRTDRPKLRLSLVLPQNIQEFKYIKTDPVRLVQIFNNLLSNAIKFCEEGNIEIGCSLENGYIKYYVKDEGIGIAQEHQQYIFDRFHQVNTGKASDNALGGTGLGLSICKGLVSAMNGSIGVVSGENTGAMFWFELPYMPGNQLGTKLKSGGSLLEDKKPLKVKKILIADDNESVHFFYLSVLSEYNVEIIKATNGEQAVELFKENPDIDMVLMDIRMPKLDGPGALKLIKQINPAIRVVAQSAFAMNDEVNKFMKLGFYTYITKPIDENQLLRLLSE